MNSDLLLIDRIDLKADSTRSLIYIQGKDSGFKALEDIVRTGPKVMHETAIPAGRYRLGLHTQSKFRMSFYTKDDVHLIERKAWEKLAKWQRDAYHPHDLIWVKDVPGFDYILIHWGNTCFDSSGCLIIGSAFGKLGPNTAVLASRTAYAKFYAQVAPLIRAGGEFITYKNSFKKTL